MAKKAKKKKAIKRSKRPSPRRNTGYAILNSFGEFWTPVLFPSEEHAKNHFDRFWELPGFKSRPSWNDYTVVPAKTTISLLDKK